MLGIDTKREIITGEFARKIWSEVLAMWLKEKTAQTEETEPKYEVEWLWYILLFPSITNVGEPIIEKYNE